MLTILAESALRSLVLGSVVWVGLNLCRIRNPHVHMTAWVMVLVASLAMPLLMHWTTVTITLDAPPVSAPAPDHLWPTDAPLPETQGAALPSDVGTPLATPDGPRHVAINHLAINHLAINWWALATAIYLIVAGLLLLRLAIGLGLTWRLARAAKPIDEPLFDGSLLDAPTTANVRVSPIIGGPVTFGSTILLPPRYIEWDAHKRRAVLAHEGAHVANRDFYILLLASLNRAVFWFSPLAWWQLIRLAELAEIISDARALEVVDDKLSYAEILLDLVQAGRHAPAALEMARASTVRSRVERILAATVTPAKGGWRKRIWTAAAIAPVLVVSAGSIAFRSESVFVPAIEGAGEAAISAHTPQHVSFYSLSHTSIFTLFRDGDDLFGQLNGQRKLRLSGSGDGTYSYPAAAGQITFAVGDDRQPAELALSQNGHAVHAARIAEVSLQGAEADARRRDAQLLDSYVGWYELSPWRVLSVTRDGDRMVVQETGQQKFAVVASGADAFSSSHDDLLVFTRDAQAKVTQVLFQEPVTGAHLAPKVAAASARLIEEKFAQRVAEVPDRFRDQSPQPGSKEAVLRGIEDMQRGTPNYERMSARLAANIRRQESQLVPMFQSLGAVESIFFRGVGPGGYDIYGVKFANGFAEFRLLLTADGKADDVIFRPNGNDELGRVAACSEESGLRSQGDGAPISLLLYNTHGGDIQLFALDAEGKRKAHGTIGDTMSSWVWTSIDSPWVIADTSGNCLEILLPGQRTQYHTVEATRASGRPEHPAGRRTAPLAGSEVVLRQYIEALVRGEPIYDRMTSEVAAQTRQQLAFNQAILARLGALRAMSFRGVTGLGSDIYMAHFANGTAEWRISLTRDGTVERIALGPQ